MQLPSRPVNERQRLAALTRYNLLDSAADPALDDLTALAAEICNTPIALITLIDEDRQWFKSKYGLSVTETPREFSFCAHAILATQPLVVGDSLADPRFSDNPLVTHAPHVCFYAGVPLVDQDGFALGTFCVIDHVPRTLTPAQLNALQILSRQVIAQFELQRHTTELARSESRLRLALDAGDIATFDWEVSTGAVSWSNSAESRWGLAAGGFGGTFPELFARLHPDDASAVRAELERCMAERIPYRGEFRVFWPDRSEHWLAARGQFSYDTQGNAEWLRGVVGEISERKRAQEMLALGHERFQIVARATNDAVWDWNLGTNALWWNENYQSLFGYPSEEIQPTIDSWLQRIHPDDVTSIVRARHGVIERGGNTWTAEYRFRRRDGSYANIFDRGYVVHDGQGHAVRMIGAMQDVSARKSAEANARLLTQRLVSATEAGSIGIWDWELDTDTWYASPTYFTMLGYEPADGPLDRFVWFERVHPDDREPIGDRIRAVLEGGSTRYEYEARLRHADGDYRWVRVVGRVLEFGPHGLPKHLLGVRMDITERKNAERSVEQLNRVYAVLSDINQTIVREKDPARMLAAACRISVEKGHFALAWIGLLDAENHLQIAAHAGADAETLGVVRDLIGRAGQAPGCFVTHAALTVGSVSVCNEVATHPEAAPWREAALSRGYRAMASLPLTSASRVIGTFNLYSTEPGLFDADELRLLEELATDVAFALQVTEQEAERRRVEHALGESEQRFRQLAESIKEVFWMTELATGKMLYLSPAYEAIWGRSCASVCESPDLWFEAIHPEDRSRVAAARLETAASYDEEYRVVRPDGGVRWVRDRAFPVHDARGQVMRRAGVAEDVTSRHLAQSELRRREEEFRTLIENVSDLVTVIDNRGVIVFQSPSAQHVLGYTVAEMLGKNAREFAHPEDVAGAARGLRLGLRSRDVPLPVEFRYRHKDGSWRHLQAIGRFMPRTSGVGAIVVNSRDVTEQRVLEEQLRHAQKMEAIGQLAGGIAHDFNNILTVIHGYGSLLMMGDDLSAESVDAAQQIVQASEQAANLTRQLLAFGRRQVLQPRNLDLNDVVRGLAKMLRRLVPENVQLNFELQARPILARADAGMLDQVLMNLVVNARDAMPGGGQLVVQTWLREVSEMSARALSDAKPGRYACLRVSDTGCGISEEHRRHIFEPFFTTKDPGKGTGLGLATVFGIVKQHGGFLSVETALQRGTTFDVCLPAIEADKQSERASTGVVNGGSELVLLVEDEDAVRRLTRAVLERSGYEVLEASNGPEALRIWQEHRQSVRLVLTDIVMPGGLSGLELGSRLHGLNPQLPVIFTSGYSADIAGRELSLREGENFVQKPSSPQQILKAVRRSLDGGRSSADRFEINAETREAEAKRTPEERAPED